LPDEPWDAVTRVERTLEVEQALGVEQAPGWSRPSRPVFKGHQTTGLQPLRYFLYFLI